MDKILIKLQVPAVQGRFDLFVPRALEISTLTKIIAEGVEDLCNGRYVSSHEEMLNQKDPDRLFDPQKTLLDYGVTDGSVLVLT